MNTFLNYLFSATPGSQMEFYIPLSALALFLVFASIIFSIIYKNRKKKDFAFKRIFKRTSKTIFFMGFALGIYLLVRYENIPYFSMRLWLYVILLLILFFIGWYTKAYFKDYPKEKNVVIKKAKSVKKSAKYTTSKKRK
ncbi:hypothetical protein GF354_06615 [Candidatus Peregrinibacteria bacterium]|nr:hypothetical protein [Candidatus Peregrinibacteria bacterium]